MRRVFRSSRRFDVVRSIFSGGRVFTADKTSPATTFTSSINCHVSSAYLSQSTQAQQCAEAKPDPAANHALSLTFSGSQWYDSSDPASYWKPLHDGTACTWYQVFKPTVSTVHVIHSTRLFVAATEIGHTTYINNLTNFFCLVANGAAETLSLSGGVPSVGTPTYTSLKFSTSSTPDGDFRVRRSSVATGNSGALSSSDPGGPLRLGAGIAASNRLPLQAVWYAFLYAPYVISSADDAAVRDWINVTYGILPG